MDLNHSLNMMVHMRQRERSSKISNLMIIESGPMEGCVTIPRMYFNAIIIWAWHEGRLMNSLLTVASILAFFNLSFLLGFASFFSLREICYLNMGESRGKKNPKIANTGRVKLLYGKFLRKEI